MCTGLDTSTLDFLAHLCRNLPESGLLVLFSWRDEETDSGRARWLGEQLRNPAIVDVALRRLTLAETIRQLAGYPTEIGEAVHRQSAGNPYLSAELARGGATAVSLVAASSRFQAGRRRAYDSPGRGDRGDAWPGADGRRTAGGGRGRRDAVTEAYARADVRDPAWVDSSPPSACRDRLRAAAGGRPPGTARADGRTPCGVDAPRIPRPVRWPRWPGSMRRIG